MKKLNKKKKSNEKPKKYRCSGVNCENIYEESKLFDGKFCSQECWEYYWGCMSDAYEAGETY